AGEGVAPEDRAIDSAVRLEPHRTDVGRHARLAGTRSRDRRRRLGLKRSHTQVDQLDRLSLETETVLSLVLALERLEPVGKAPLEIAVGKRCLELVVLARVAHVCRAAQNGLVCRHAPAK